VFFVKKLIFILLVFVVLGTAVHAADILNYPPPLKGGTVLLDAGLGLTWHPGWLFNWKMSIPPLFASVEYCLPVGVPISVGGMFSLYQYKYDYNPYGYHYIGKYTYLIFTARGNWHWNLNVKNLDLYTGINLGYRAYIHSDERTNDYNYGGFYSDIQAGLHYYFTPNIGLMAEVGYPYWAKAGLALKF
jgi:hypothetical protein